MDGYDGPIERLVGAAVARARAGPHPRSDEAALAASSTPFEDALAGVRADPAGHSEDFQRQVAEYLGGINSPFAGMIRNTVTGDGSQARGLFGALSRLTGRASSCS